MCKLNKSLYGLKQTFGSWFNELRKTLNTLGFFQCNSDYSLFISTKNNIKTIILAYVDNMLITEPCLRTINQFKTDLKQHYTIKDLRELKYFLRLELSHKDNQTFTSQRKYDIDLLKFQNLRIANLLQHFQ